MEEYYPKEFFDFIENCIVAFAEVGIEIDESTRQYMITRYNLFPFTFMDNWPSPHVFTKERRLQFERILKITDKLLGNIENEGGREIYHEVMMAAYDNESIPEHLITIPSTQKWDDYIDVSAIVTKSVYRCRL
jgi:hypothetical protein